MQQLTYPTSFALALSAHILLMCLLGIDFFAVYTPSQAGQPIKTQILQAVSLDKNRVEQEIARVTAQEQAAQQVQAKKVAALRHLTEKLIAERQQHEHHLQHLNRATAAARQSLQQLRQQQRLAAQRLTALQKKSQQRAERLETQQQQQAKAARKREQHAQSLLAQRRLDYEVNKYVGVIQNAIHQYWLKPRQFSDDLACVLQIRLQRDGQVDQVRVIQPSGNSLYDRSARLAVFKASPLPVPRDPAIFNKFREFKLTVKP